MLPKLLDKLRSNESSTANYYDFHDCPFVLDPGNPKLPAQLDPDIERFNHIVQFSV
jgi:hypothetical protein